MAENKKLKLMWENNPDTPLDASNLSRFVENYTEDLTFYIDNAAFQSLPDNRLKMRANSKFVLRVPTTTAYFDFNDSYISNDSTTEPIEVENASFRIENVRQEPYDKSIAIEEETENLILNPQFDDGLNGWDTIENGASTVTSISEGFVYGDNCAKIEIDNLGSIAELSYKLIVVKGIPVTAPKYISISFYYKSNSISKLNIVSDSITDPNAAYTYYWRSEGDLQWEFSPAIAEVTLPDTSMEVQRIEIKNIPINGIGDSDPTASIAVKISSEEIGSTIYIDDMQLEEKIFASSYTMTTRNDSIFKLAPHIIDPNHGVIDIEFLMKNFININTIIAIKSSVGDDLLQLYFDANNETLVFSMTDNTVGALGPIQASLSLPDIILHVDKWIRIIVSWNKTEGVKIFSSLGSTSTYREFIPHDFSELTEIHLGADYDATTVNLLNGIVNHIKFGAAIKSDNEIISCLANAPMARQAEYKMFENSNHFIILDENYLDGGTFFLSERDYYIWIIDSGIDESEILISLSDEQPIGINRLYATLVGGFSTDASIDIINNSLWATTSYDTHTVHTDRFLLNGKQTSDVGIEFRTTPWGDTNDAKFNIPTYVTDHFYGVTGNTNFLDINPDGTLRIDNVYMDNNIISAYDPYAPYDNVELLITGNRSHDNTGEVHIHATTVNIDSNTGGEIQLDLVDIKANRIYTSAGYGLIINGDRAGSEILLDSESGEVRITGTTTLINPSQKITLESDIIEFKSNTDFIVAPNTTTNVRFLTDGGEIQLDTVMINNNVISTIDGDDLTFKSVTGNIVVDDNMRFDDDSVLYFNNPRAAGIITGGKRHITLMDATDNADPETPNVANVYGMGVQIQGSDTSLSSTYMKSAKHFAWYKGGVHSDTLWQGGVLLAALTADDDISPANYISTTSRFYAGKVHNAVWNDLAECWLKAEEDVEYNKVVVNTENGVKHTTKRAQKGTVGIVSNTYGFVLGDKGLNEKDLNAGTKIPIAISGRVKALYSKKLSLHDEVVSSKEGNVVKASFIEKVFMRDRIIGRVDSIIDTNICWIRVYY